MMQDEARELYFRLLIRTHKPFRVNSLSYASIPCINNALKELQNTDPPLIESVVPQTLEEGLNLLKKDEIVVLAKKRKISVLGANVQRF